MPDALDHPETAPRQLDAEEDASLLQRAGDDGSAFAVIVQRHTDGLFRYAAARVGPGPAEDVVADTFAAAFDRRDRFDPARGEVRGWLFGIASVQLRRYGEDERRWLQRVAAASGEARVDDHDGELRVVERADAARMAPELAAALLSLSPAERDVLLLFALEELTHEQIASVLGIRRGSAKTRLSRGCARLRDQLARAKVADMADGSES